MIFQRLLFTVVNESPYIAHTSAVCSKSAGDKASGQSMCELEEGILRLPLLCIGKFVPCKHRWVFPSLVLLLEVADCWIFHRSLLLKVEAVSCSKINARLKLSKRSFQPGDDQ